MALLLSGCAVSSAPEQFEERLSQRPQESILPDPVEVAPHFLSRTTADGIVITAIDTVELLAKPACWNLLEPYEERGEVPPADICMAEATAHIVTASIGDLAVEESVIVFGGTQTNRLAVRIVGQSSLDGLSVVVVDTAPEVEMIRLRGPDGTVVDQVHSKGQLVALAAQVDPFAVDGLDATGLVVGSCLPDESSSDGRTKWDCTRASTAPPPATTVP